MYSAQKTPAASPYTTPAAPKLRDPELKGSKASRPSAAMSIHRKSMARRDAAMASASGPANSKATAIPSGMESSDREKNKFMQPIDKPYMTITRISCNFKRMRQGRQTASKMGDASAI